MTYRYVLTSWGSPGISFNWYLIPIEVSDGLNYHYNGVIMDAMASQITNLTIIYSTIYSGADQRKQQSSASLTFGRGISPVTDEFPAQMASNAENVSIWCRHHHQSVVSSFNLLSPGGVALLLNAYFEMRCGNYFHEHFLCYRLSWVEPGPTNGMSTLVEVMAWYR